MKRSLAVGVFWLCFGSLECNAHDDWTQWRGPNRMAVSTETGLLKTWPSEGPPSLWIFKNAGAGYSGFSIVGNQLMTMGADSRKEYVLCIDARTGEELWRTEIGSRYGNHWGDGPRSTPTIDGDHVFALSASGNLVCLNKIDGAMVWEEHLADFGGAVPSWGYSESVLVDSGQVVCTPGGKQGSIAAFDCVTGELKWQTSKLTDGAQYSSIVVAEHPDKRHYIQLLMRKLVGVDPSNGNVLWQAHWSGRTAVIPTPIYKDEKVYVTSGYGTGSQLISLAGLAPRSIWQNKVMKNQHGGVILVDGYLYGYSDGVGWVCQDWQNGERVWNEKGSLGKGAIGYADAQFYLVDQKQGQVALIDATPEGWTERGRFTLKPLSSKRKSDGGIWAHPTIAHGKLFLRDQEYVYCFDLKAR